MGRSDFAIGLVIGSLSGLTAGYLLSRKGHATEETMRTEADAPAAIELKPVRSRNSAPAEPVELPARRSQGSRE